MMSMFLAGAALASAASAMIPRRHEPARLDRPTTVICQCAPPPVPVAAPPVCPSTPPAPPPVPPAPPSPSHAALEVRWGTGWYPGEVIGVACPGFVRTRFTGYGDEWDEVVTTADVRAAGSRDASTSAAASARPHPSGSAQPAADSARIDASDPAPVGQAVEVRDGPSWYRATIIGHACAGLLHVHYNGWESPWDAWVPRDRVRRVR